MEPLADLSDFQLFLLCVHVGYPATAGQEPLDVGEEPAQVPTKPLPPGFDPANAPEGYVAKLVTPACGGSPGWI